MISLRQTLRLGVICALPAAVGCGVGFDADDNANAIIDPPVECSDERPDCSISGDFPVGSDLSPSNSAGIRYSEEGGGLVVDRLSSLPDADSDGVPDDADGCPGTPDWITCDGDPSNDGIYATAFYDPSGSDEAVRRRVATTTVDIPRIDVYFLIDATPTLSEEIAVLQNEILSIIDDVRLEFGDARFGLGLYRAYALTPLAPAYSQAPYHHILDLTDDEVLIERAVSTLNTVANTSAPTAATQALYSVASGSGLAAAVPNRGACPVPEEEAVGYPCFRPEALHVVMNVTDAEVYNGPRPEGPVYGDPPFAAGIGAGVVDLPPVQMFPELFVADSATLSLDLGDLAGQSLTLMGMSTRLTNQVNTAIAPGCAPPPPVPPDDPPGSDMDYKDAVLQLRFDSAVASALAFANNTHWPGANVALFTDPVLDPATALACDGGAMNVGTWGAIEWNPVTAQTYYLVADGIVPAADPGFMPEGAFSISIVHDGDPPNPAWQTTDAPVSWIDVESALLTGDVRVASVVTLADALSMPSAGSADARMMAIATDALTKSGAEWVTEHASANGEGLDSAVSNTIRLARTESVYDIDLTAVDEPDTAFDETELVFSIRSQDCAQGEPLACGSGSPSRCGRCDVGSVVDFDVLFANTAVQPTTVSQVFDFELLVQADETVEVERIPVRVMVPDEAAHVFDETPGTSFYRNQYDSTARCNTPPERPKWGELTWNGSVPDGTTIEFQIRTAPTLDELATAVPAIVEIPTDTESQVLDLTEELIADGQPWGLPYLQITALLNPSNDPSATPTLEGWSFEFVCEAAE